MYRSINQRLAKRTAGEAESPVKRSFSEVNVVSPKTPDWLLHPPPDWAANGGLGRFPLLRSAWRSVTEKNHNFNECVQLFNDCLAIFTECSVAAFLCLQEGAAPPQSVLVWLSEALAAFPLQTFIGIIPISKKHNFTMRNTIQENHTEIRLFT